MDANVKIVLYGFLIPFGSLVVMFCFLVITNRKTTGEIKFILPPEILLKVMALLLIVVVTFILAYFKVLDQSVTAAILSSVGTGTVGMHLNSKNKE
jgi:hypothetical protein